jgi:hypothetical protein
MAEIRAPFTAEQVEILRRFQTGGWFHPFTCPSRGQHNEGWEAYNGATLVPEPEAMRCPAPDCSYTQDWVHDFMVDPDWVSGMEAKHAAIDRQLRRSPLKRLRDVIGATRAKGGGPSGRRRR